MDIFIKTAFAAVFTGAIILCFQVGYPKVAKIGFVVIAIGFVAMLVVQEYMLNAFTASMNAFMGSPDKSHLGVFREFYAAAGISRLTYVITAVGVSVTLISCIHRIFVKRKDVFAPLITRVMKANNEGRLRIGSARVTEIAEDHHE